MSVTRSCRILILVGLVALPCPLHAQNWKDQLQQSILTFIKLTAVSSDGVSIANAGSLLAVAKDGIAANLTSLTPTSHVRGGVIRKSGGLLSAVFSSSSDRNFKLDEQVYLTKVSIKDDAIELFLVSSKTETIEVQGSRQKARYRGVLSFDFPKGNLSTADFASVRDTIAAVLRGDATPSPTDTFQAAGSTIWLLDKSTGCSIGVPRYVIKEAHYVGDELYDNDSKWQMRWTGGCVAEKASGTGRLFIWPENLQLDLRWQRPALEIADTNSLALVDGVLKVTLRPEQIRITPSPNPYAGFPRGAIVHVPRSTALRYISVVVSLLQMTDKALSTSLLSGNNGTFVCIAYDGDEPQLYIRGKPPACAVSVEYGRHGPMPEVGLTYQNKPAEEYAAVEGARIDAAHRAFEAAGVAQKKAEREQSESAARNQRLANRQNVVRRLRIDALVSGSDLSANPFPYQGKVVGVFTTFSAMRDANSAWFGGQEFLVLGVPSTRFPRPVYVLLAGRVLGTQKVTILGTEVTVPKLQFVDAYPCQQSGCSELNP